MTHSQPTSHKTREYAGHKWLVLALTAFFAIALLVPSQFAADIDAQAFQKAEGISPVILEEALEPPAGHDAGEPDKGGSVESPLRIIEGKVAKNHTFSKILGEAGMAGKTVDDIVRAVRPVFNLNRLKRGAHYKLALAADDSMDFFDYHINKDLYLRVERQGNTFKPELREIDYAIENGLIRGTIRNNLITAMQKSQGNFRVAMDLADIFSWDIDFIKDLRRGDEFQLVVEKKYRDGRFIKFGKILAAVFVNKEKAFDAVYFESSPGKGHYYTAKGEPLRKQFLKSPLQFSRISSKYSHRRFHPIYKTYLPHFGVDYAAPLGTPVRAVSDGIVAASGYDSRSGNFIALKHNGIYRTAYSHLSRFARGIVRGAPVVQGQVIGYVGATGAATGPHLCFQIKRYGKPVNPLTFKSPGGLPLAEELREAFFQTSLMGMLEGEAKSASLPAGKRRNLQQG